MTSVLQAPWTVFAPGHLANCSARTILCSDRQVWTILNLKLRLKFWSLVGPQVEMTAFIGFDVICTGAGNNWAKARKHSLKNPVVLRVWPRSVGNRNFWILNQRCFFCAFCSWVLCIKCWTAVLCRGTTPKVLSWSTRYLTLSVRRLRDAIVTCWRMRICKGSVGQQFQDVVYSLEMQLICIFVCLKRSFNLRFARLPTLPLPWWWHRRWHGHIVDLQSPWRISRSILGSNTFNRIQYFFGSRSFFYWANILQEY